MYAVLDHMHNVILLFKLADELKELLPSKENL